MRRSRATSTRVAGGGGGGVANGGTTRKPDAMGRASIPERTCLRVTHTYRH